MLSLYNLNQFTQIIAVDEDDDFNLRETKVHFGIQAGTPNKPFNEKVNVKPI